MSQIRRAVAVANVPALTMLVYQFTGDARWLDARYAPKRGRGLDDNDSGGLPEDVQAEIREAAADALVRMDAGESPRIASPATDEMIDLVRFYLGENVAEPYGEMFATEIARRALEPHREPRVSPAADFKVLVIGAGVGGIAAAKSLGEMGIPYLLVEKREAPGGTWLQNTYPGAGVDTPSHLYSFHFARRDWSQHFERRVAIQTYLADTFAEVGATPHARFETEVQSAVFDEAASVWRVTVKSRSGEIEVLTANVVISAVGVLNRPVFPDVRGIEKFRGRWFHSASWPEDLDLTGKRVAVVGTGATSMQIVPAIAGQVRSLTVFQRSPQWVAPFAKFLTDIPDELRWLIAQSPIYRAWYWLRLFWQFGDDVIAALEKDPSWEHPERAMNRKNDGHRAFFTRYMQEQLGERDDLLDKTLPTYPPFGKRILLDNGWFKALRRDNVDLVAEAVVEVDETGLTTSSGARYEPDVIVWASGFESTHFLSTLDVRGRGGVALKDAWQREDPRAYLGITTPGFPNLFMLAGPHSIPGSGSVIFNIELQMRYVAQIVGWMVEHNAASVDVKPEVNDRYNELIDETHARLVWVHPGMTTYYRNSRGRVVFIAPFKNVDFWHMAKRPKMDEFTVVPRGAP
jgi:4-hydroxyacetophenone monooxygenase